MSDIHICKECENCFRDWNFIPIVFIPYYFICCKASRVDKVNVVTGRKTSDYKLCEAIRGCNNKCKNYIPNKRAIQRESKKTGWGLFIPCPWTMLRKWHG